jgi:serine/threonine-protein kinase
VGKVLNQRYKVLKKIGEGGFGSVYQGEQLQMGRPVALKVLAPVSARDPALVERFKREVKAACNLRDPHTIITYDFDQADDGLLYMAMELLTGQSLYAVMRRVGPVDPLRAVRILRQVCTSLAEAHQQGIVHRDIKPENIYLEDRPGNSDFVKVLDFGIAKIIGDNPAGQGPRLTATGQTLGTLEYMSPEQLMGRPLDGRSDIYALGIVAYEMLTSKLPFSGKEPAAMIKAHLSEVPLVPSRSRPVGAPPAPEALDQLILQMLAKSRDDRPARIELVAEVLDAIALGLAMDLRAGRSMHESETGPVSVASESGRVAALAAMPPSGPRAAPSPEGPASAAAAPLAVAAPVAGSVPNQARAEGSGSGPNVDPSAVAPPLPKVAPPRNIAPLPKRLRTGDQRLRLRRTLTAVAVVVFATVVAGVGTYWLVRP